MKIQLKIKTTKGESVIVDGKRVTLPGFEGFSFIIHRAIEARSKWTITEETTALSLCSDFERRTSQTDTIAATLARFERLGLTSAVLSKQIAIVKRHQDRLNARRAAL